jgi:hypothetical protein
MTQYINSSHGTRPCWCRKCKGTTRDLRTWKLHGRCDQTPVHAPLAAAMSLPDLVDFSDGDDVDAHSGGSESGEGDGSDGHSDDASDHEDDLAEELAGHTSFLKDLLQAEMEAGDDTVRVGTACMSPGDVVVFFLDWMGVTKGTDAAAEQIYNFLKVLTPIDFELPSFSKVKIAARVGPESRCRTVDLCRNDCIAYYDSENMTGDDEYM